MAQGPHCVKSMPIKQMGIVLRKNSPAGAFPAQNTN